jgi:hypothetical protein
MWSHSTSYLYSQFKLRPNNKPSAASCSQTYTLLSPSTCVSGISDDVEYARWINYIDCEHWKMCNSMSWRTASKGGIAVFLASDAVARSVSLPNVIYSQRIGVSPVFSIAMLWQRTLCSSRTRITKYEHKCLSISFPDCNRKIGVIGAPTSTYAHCMAVSSGLSVQNPAPRFRTFSSPVSELSYT